VELLTRPQGTYTIDYFVCKDCGWTHDPEKRTRDMVAPVHECLCWLDEEAEIVANLDLD
jgi:hypothetical protein